MSIHEHVIEPKLLKKCCRNCHFLSKYHVAHSGEVYRNTWETEERSALKVADHYAAECHKGIWSEGINPAIKNELKEILLKDRADNCFFIETHEGMSYQAADELFRLRRDNIQLRKSYKYTQIALWIAALSLVANLIYTVISDFFFQ